MDNYDNMYISFEHKVRARTLEEGIMKVNTEGKGSSKTVTADEHNATRRAAKARQRRHRTAKGGHGVARQSVIEAARQERRKERLGARAEAALLFVTRRVNGMTETEQRYLIEACSALVSADGNIDAALLQADLEVGLAPTPYRETVKRALRTARPAGVGKGVDATLAYSSVSA